MNVYIYSLNASFSGNRWSPFNVSIDSIEMQYCSSIIAANKLWQIDTLTVSFSDERSIPFYKMYLGVDTLSVAVKCAYDYDNNRDSLRVFTSSHILNGDISDGGNLLRLNHDGNRDTLLPLSKEQRVPVNNKDDYSVEYKLNKKGDWEITKSPH
ncbi:MAG: hypothetical protein LBG19_11745 [Prevotellaceae bacterium]|jgi:hypothetical protein|nr:hypothetical protein [Prevotellaceae bacterium]